MAPTGRMSSALTVTSETNAGLLKEWLSNVPDTANITVHVTLGDRPFDGGTTEITARWTQEIKPVNPFARPVADRPQA